MGYQSVMVWYFTGTGNARKVARWTGETALKQGLDFDVRSIVDPGTIPVPAPGQLLAFVSPIHGFNFPKVMLSFLWRFPRGTNDMVLLNTRAGMRVGPWPTPGLTGVAFLLAFFILRFKGYRLRGTLPVDLPSNWISIHPGLREPTIRFLHQKMEQRVKPFLEKVLSGRRAFPLLYEIVPDLLLLPISLGYFLVGRFAFAKTFVASSDCNRCGACVSGCPVKAIRLVDGRPFWGFRCESCMKCMGLCSRKAIETAHGSFAVVCLLNALLIVPLFYLGFESLFFRIENGFFRFVVESALFLSFLGLWYRLVHGLMRFKPVERLVVLTSLTKYRFWGRRYRVPS